MRRLFFSRRLRLGRRSASPSSLSLAGGAADFLSKVQLSTLWSEGWFPRRNLFDVKTILAGTLDRGGDRDGRRGAARARCGALSLGVRAASRATVPQADPRDARQRPERGDGVLRAAGHQSRPRAALLRLGRAALQPDVRPDSRWACWSRRWWPPWPRTRCTRCPHALREASFGLGARRRATSLRVVFPAAVSGITAVAHPRGLPGDRRDDDRRDRGRRNRRIAVQPQPASREVRP